MIANTTISVATRGKGLYPFTKAATGWAAKSAVKNGLFTAFIQHTSCSLVIQENAEPDVTLDMRDFFEHLVSEDAIDFRHMAEGPDDMTSHIRSALTQTSLTIPFVAGRMTLGTWQGLYVFEHRTAPHQRQIVLSLVGE